MPTVIVCGICGGAGAGKSTLAGAVVGILEQLGIGVALLPFDDYYRDHGHLGIAERALVNYDHPDSLDLGLATPDVRRLLDVAVFIDVTEDIRLERRIVRDVEERGRTPESVRAQFAAPVAPMHERFVAPSAAHADGLVDGTGDLAEQATDLAALLVDRLGGNATIEGVAPHS